MEEARYRKRGDWRGERGECKRAGGEEMEEVRYRKRGDWRGERGERKRAGIL